MIGHSRAMREVFRVIEQVAPTDATVLITGESGTGKERVARALHERSRRKLGPFLAINCAALPEALLESELFGHVRGSFTGAVRDHPGRVEQARGGTLFLDEIGEMSPALQAKVLRFLQEREYQRVGDSRTHTADVRVIAASNRNLKAEVEAGSFREDLYYRIKVIPLHLPPLRERREDIPLIAAHLVDGIASKLGRPGVSLTQGCLERLSRHDFPGNVRELINALEYAVALAPGRRIRAEDLPADVGGEGSRYRKSKLQGDEKSRITDALAKSSQNRAKAARLLGMNRVTLYRKMAKLGLD